MLIHVLWSRLLEDAKFLKSKFSTLKNIRAPTAMLETVVADLSLHRAGASTLPPPHSPQTPTIPPTPSRSNTLSTNQRLRGLLSGRSATLMVEKALPNPSHSTTTRTTSPPMPPPNDTKPPLLSPSTAGSGSGGSSQSNGPIVLGTQSIGASTVSLAASQASTEAGSSVVEVDTTSKVAGSAGLSNGLTAEPATATQTSSSPLPPTTADGRGS